MARGKDLIRSEGNGPPASAALTELFNRRLSIGTVLTCGGNQVGNRLAVSGDGNGFPTLNYPEKFRQASLSFRCLNFTHFNIIQSF